jgi:signal transduction histidine kinase
VIARGLVLAAVAAGLLAALTGVVYGGHAAWSVAEMLVPLGAVTVLAAAGVARARPGPLHRQFAVVAMLAVGTLAAGVALCIEMMFVSRHDAFFAALAAAYAALLGLWACRLVGRRALADLARVRAVLAAVAEGRRDVRSGLRGNDELAALGAEVDAMVARLDAEERARRSLVAAVSHDLRTPITALQLLAEALEDEIFEPERRRDELRRMTTHVRALGALIDDLFELSRLEAGELRWTLEQVDLDELVRDTVDAMRPAAEAGGVAVRAELPRGPARARANPEQLQRVLFNLIQNAIRHTPADGSVVVRALPADDGAVVVEVADTGEGIASADRERVFDAFFQAGDRAARTDGSAGLGLAIARAIVEAHGGRIWVAEAERGTRVRFSLSAG